MNEPVNEMTETSNGTHPQTANELAIVYEAVRDEAPDETSSDAAPDATVDDAALAAAVSAYEALTAHMTTEAPLAEDALPTQAEAPPVEVALPPATAQFVGLRLRMKVWTERATGKRYLMPTAFMRDVVRGQPVSDVMYAYAMSDRDTKIVTLTALEWNALPFYFFQEDGSAPPAASRPVDVVG